ncbi:MAG: DUF3305 domain-containing protein [Kiloniellales bacterium]
MKMPLTQHTILQLGVVVERRALKSRWQRYAWRPVAVFPGAPPRDRKGAWVELTSGEGWTQFHAATLPLELFRKETEAYRVAMAQHPPSLYVVLRPNEDPQVAHEVVPLLVTASPDEAQGFLEAGVDIVEPVAMPEVVAAFVQAFIDSHHVEEPFVKRQRRPKRAPAAPGLRSSHYRPEEDDDG